MPRLFLVPILTLLLAACSQSPGPLEQIRADGELVVLTRNAPTTWYEGRDGPEGYEHDLAARFAESLGVEARFVVVDSVDAVLAGIAAGEGHLGAAGITRTEPRVAEHRFGPDYFSVQQEVVCRRGGARPRLVEDLAGLALRVSAGTSYVERLKELRAAHPELTWEESAADGTEQLLQQVWSGEVDCTVADSNIVAVNRRYLPELSVAFPLSEEQPLAWALPAAADALARELERWFAQESQENLLARLYQRYYGRTEIFDFVDLRAYNRRIGERLPKYEALFREHAAANQVPWTLLAAQAYQESHWNPRAKSPTGVRGMMMLTQPTAEELGVKNRLDAAESIAGGARYLRRMMDRLPETIPERDRAWFALAAYNVGFAHLRDARKLAARLGRDADNWLEVREVLPLLSEKEYYSTLDYGYARGAEPVHYVQRVRDYQEILERRLARRDPREQVAQE